MMTDRELKSVGGHDYIRLMERTDGGRYIDSNGVIVEETDERFSELLVELESED